MLEKLLDLFFPRTSLRGVAGYWITEEEWSDIPVRIYVEPPEFLTERGVSYLDSLGSACHYHDSFLLQRALHTLKYKRVPGLARELSTFVVQVGNRCESSNVTLVPVPLYWKRAFDRGFNQAALLAKCTASALHLPYAMCLRRTRDTGHQAWRSRSERLHSMRGAFAVRHSVRTVPKHIVLIDDIATTGATLDACACALKEAGALTVDAWVVARS